jgi:GTP-binding protein Era
LTEERGQIVFVDTPGIHRAREGGINEYMIQEVRRALEGPDLILYLIDPMSKVEAEQKVVEFLKEADSRLLVLVNKCDLRKKFPAKFDWLPAWVEEMGRTLAGSKCHLLGVREISAERGTHIPELLDEVFSLLPSGPALFDDPDALTDRSARFVVAELIRKQLFLRLGDELPYSCAVEIESYREREKPVRISAVIHVERESQKGMVIGAAGKKIKEIGTHARTEIEALLQEKVFLELRVKVLDSWTSQARKMKGLGYILE